jgi:hypothetical protein
VPPPPAPKEVDTAGAGEFLIRINLGAQANFMRLNAGSTLRKPGFVSVDLGYGILPNIAVLLRAATFLSYDAYGVQFLGAGASISFAPEGMYVAGLLGVSVLAPSFASDQRVQGLAMQLELGQRWPLPAGFDFGIGAHFELATPFAGYFTEATSFGMGLFTSLGY